MDWIQVRVGWDTQNEVRWNIREGWLGYRRRVEWKWERILKVERNKSDAFALLRNISENLQETLEFWFILNTVE